MNRDVLKRLSYVILGLALSTASVAMNIGVVNVPVLLEQSPQALAASKRLETSFSKQKNLLEKERQALQSEGEELEKSQILLKEADLKRKQKELGRKGQEWQRKMKELQELMNAKSNEELSKMQTIVNRAIQQVGERDKFDLILYEGIAFSSNAANITNRVLQEMSRIHDADNQKLNKK
jgi:outer membrane protein